jgi:branched-chain amino acid transport system permease protein
MELFVQQVLSGLAVGGIYASLALALVMIYQATELVNFAQGEMAMFSTYIAWQLIQWGLPFWVAFFITIAISLVAGIVIERLIIRPARNAPVLAIVIIFIGLLVILNSMAGWIWTYTNQIFPSPFPDQPYHGVNVQELGAIGVTLIVLLLVFAFFRFTTLGLAMRAAAQNPTSSRLVGIRVGWMLALGWGLAAAIGAVAGIMVAPKLQLEPNMMGSVLVYAFAGALVGGISSPGGAVFGGFAVGVVENLVGTYVPVVGSQIKLAVALILIVGVLTIRPAGIFGRPVVHRV